MTIRAWRKRHQACSTAWVSKIKVSTILPNTSIPQLTDIRSHAIVNVSGSSPEDYAECARRIAALDGIPAIELNISCPNVHDGGMASG